MTWGRLGTIAAAGAAAVLALTAAQHPSALAETKGGLWEISGLPGAAAPAKQCVTDTAVFAQFEHRAKSCKLKVIKDGASSAIVEYSCGDAGFGRSKVDVITPRSLRIDTQGIADNLPFGYVLQARRVGDCPAPETASRH